MKKKDENFTQENFDFMSDLYKTNPEEFKRIRAVEIERMISSTHPESQKRLRGLQFRIDSTLRKYKNPLMRMEKMSQLLWEEGMNRLNGALHGVPSSSQKKKCAQVLPLFPKSK